LKFPGLLLVVLILTGILVATDPAFADPLRNASKQRIGNYDLEMTTEPINPVAGNPVNILLRIAGVNGDDLVDVQIQIRLAKDGAELHRTNPIIVPYGHHSFEYTFAKAGRHALYVDVKDYAYSGETLTFTFLINIAGPFDNLIIMISLAGGVAAAGGSAMVFIRRKKRQIERLK